MRRKLMDVLAEPGTGAPLALMVDREEGDRILEGTLHSSATGKKYPTIRGIPRFVGQEGYTDSFGYQWNLFRTTQIDSVTGAMYSQKRFDAEVSYSADELSGRWLLDAGCGAGRFAEIAARLKANVVALDYSSAVDAARQTLVNYPNANVVQGDLLNPPFLTGAFQYAYCIGVVQHTPNPTEAIRSVLRCLEPQGRFAFTIYGKKPWTKLNGKYLIRPITRRIPKPLLLEMIRSSMPVLFPLTEALFRLPLVGKVASFFIPVANYPHRRDLTVEKRYQETILDTFDALSPQFDSPMTAGEVEAVLRSAGVESYTFRTRVPVNVVGRT